MPDRDLPGHQTDPGHHLSGARGDPVLEMGELLEPRGWCRQRWCRADRAAEHFDGDGCSCHSGGHGGEPGDVRGRRRGSGARGRGSHGSPRGGAPPTLARRFREPADARRPRVRGSRAASHDPDRAGVAPLRLCVSGLRDEHPQDDRGAGDVLPLRAMRSRGSLAAHDLPPPPGLTRIAGRRALKASRREPAQRVASRAAQCGASEPGERRSATAPDSSRSSSPSPARRHDRHASRAFRNPDSCFHERGRASATGGRERTDPHRVAGDRDRARESVATRAAADVFQ